MRRVIAFVVVIFAVAFLPASATIINVPDDQPSIQAGIDASISGDTVRVAPDTYVENIDFSGRNIILGSWFLDAGDPSYISSTIIDGGATATVVTFESGETNDAKIIGFTIQNGLAQVGGGIYCYNGSSPTISDNIISGNSSNYGGGINCYHHCSPTISNNTISGNGNSASRGGGIYCYFSSNPTISNNTISGNSAYRGGAIFCGESSPTLSDNIIIGNSATQYGGGINCSFDSSPTISGNTIWGNSSSQLGGGIYCHSSSPVITNTIFWGDSAPNGPEIYSYGGSPAITYCDVQGGWEGEGNIDCDPQYCDPENDNFHLDAASCCVGAGEGGVDIGAFGVGCGQDIPTISEWGMLIMGLLLLAIGTVTLVRRRQAATEKAA